LTTIAAAHSPNGFRVAWKLVGGVWAPVPRAFRVTTQGAASSPSKAAESGNGRIKLEEN